MKNSNLLLLILLISLGGCTSVQLRDNTIKQGQSLTDLEYEMVLDNIAMAIDRPGVLPWHAIISKGAITVNDLVTPSFAYKGGPPNRSLGINASRAWQGDWTFTPVIDPIVLTKLQGIYAGYTDEPWLHVEKLPPKFDGFSGHYGMTFVWVERKDIKGLVDVTMQVLSAANSVTNQSLGFLPNAVHPFINKLNDTNDLPSQFLLGQLPPGVKTLVSSPKNSVSDENTDYWLANTIASGLNKTIQSWTTNEFMQFVTSIQLTKPGVLPSDLKASLNKLAQSNILLRQSVSLLQSYYPDTFSITTNTLSSTSQNNFLLRTGPTVTIPH